MFKSMLVSVLSVLLAFGSVFGAGPNGPDGPAAKGANGTSEKMMVESGNIALDLDLGMLTGAGSAEKGTGRSVLNFEVARDSMFKLLVFNNEFRGPIPSSLGLVPQDYPALPERLEASFQQLVLESLPWGGQYNLIIRDGASNFTFFNIEGQLFDYDTANHTVAVSGGRALVAKEFATALGRPELAGTVVGTLSMTAKVRALEVSQIVNGEVRSDEMPSMRDPEAGSVPGPDVIVGDLSGLAQFGSSGTRVGLAVGTDSCNFGTENLHWFQLPDNDHPVIPQNLYRMSGGTNNDERFEQIGQGNVKHAFQALTENICGLGCNGVGDTNLGSGCSDPYVASLNAGPNLGSRAWINPFTGAFPRGDSGTSPNSHAGHTHNGTSHRILVEQADLSTTANPGATYYAEALYITPHEFAWCSTHPGQCNMNNNVSYRRFTVSGTTSFTFTAAAATQRQKAALTAWTGATIVDIDPAPGTDGIGAVAYKVTNPSAGVWHYEYAVYNQNMDRGIQSFSVPLGNGVTLSNIGFHMPIQQPAWTADGTVGSAGFSSTPWVQSQAGGAMVWNSETFAQNQNANAIRWGTLYNFRFDSNRPPQSVQATIGFFKTGAPITVTVQGPTPAVVANVSVTGRVLTPEGQPVRGTQVVMTDAGGGNARVVLTSSFGYFNFDNVVPGASYTFTVSTKRYTFNPVTVPVNDNITSLDITATGATGRGRR